MSGRGIALLNLQIPRLVVSLIAGALIGLVAFECSIGLVMVDPGRIGWLMGPAAGDWANHFLGWHMFRGERWTLPLGGTPAFLFPVGTSVGMTDSIPLLALPFKALGLFPGRDIQYIGFWLLTSFALQGAAGALLLQTYTPRLLLHALGAALFVLAPPILARIGHPALTAHWLLLGCFWVHYHSAQLTPRQAFLACAALTFCSSAIHPYLTLMVVVLVGAYYARFLSNPPGRWFGDVLAPLTALAVLAALVHWQSGYFVVPGSTLVAGGLGLGVFSLNLLNPLTPMGRSRLFDLPFTPPVGGQFEGYAYLGAGVIALGAIALGAVALRRRGGGPAPGRWNLPLLAACTGLTIFAISPTVTFGPRILWQYNEAWWGPLQQFRASGRFAWPAFYLLLFLIIRTIVSRFTYRQAAWLLGGAVLLQVVDASGAFAEARGIRQRAWRNPPLRTERFWARALPHYRNVSLYPTNLCTPPGEAIDFYAFALVAGRAHTTLNAGVTSRIDYNRLNQYCQWQSLDFNGGFVDRRTLYVMSIRLARGFERRAQIPVVCTDMDEFGVCFARETYSDWQDAFDLNLSIMPPLEELAAFRERLEIIYRNDLHRAATARSGSTDIQIRSLVRFVSYRLTGCGYDEARDKTLRELDGYHELRLCEHHLSRRLRDLEQPGYQEQLPERAEAVGLLHVIANRSTVPTRIVSSVDEEGEAVWLQEYVGHRLTGRNPEEATELVRASIRAIS